VVVMRLYSHSFCRAQLWINAAAHLPGAARLSISKEPV
jgi:hypothetical protein